MSFKIYHKERKSNGRRDIYILGIKVFSYKRKIDDVYASLSIEEIAEIQSNYKIIEQNIIKKKQNNEKIKVAFLVGLSSMFPAKSIMDEMLKDADFDVKLVIIPDFRFGIEHCNENLEKSYKEYYEKYKDIILLSSPDITKDNIKIEDIADIVFLPVPYDISHSKYNLLNLIQKGLLPAFINYSFYNAKYDRNQLISSVVFSLYWKIFVDTKLNLEEFKEYSLLKGKNAVLTGYCKMDEFANIKRTSIRKTIMIAPHHSIDGGFNDIMALSNFPKYADLFLELPKLYPDIDFIFRPHPALFPLLERKKFWGIEKVKNYIEKMKSNKNVIYSDYGNYLQDFINSDGIIQDCGSFLTEYFYTLKPQCYMLKDTSDIENKFISLGKQCLENSYIAYNKEDIIKFIDNVIIRGNDHKQPQRENFAKTEIMLNYPEATSYAVNCIKGIILKERKR